MSFLVEWIPIIIIIDMSSKFIATFQSSRQESLSGEGGQKEWGGGSGGL